MLKRSGCVCSLLLASLLVLATGLPAVAVRRSARSPHHAHHGRLAHQQAELEARQRAIQEKIAEGRQKAQALKHQEDSALSRLTIIQQALERKQIELADSRYRLSHTHQALQQSQVELANAQQDFRREQALAAGRLRALYEHRDVNYWEAILTAPDLGSFLSRYEYFRHVAMADSALLASLDQEQARISLAQARYDAQLQTISAVTADISQQKSQIQQQSEQQADIVHKLDTNRQYYDQYVQQMEQDDAQIEAMIRQLISEQRRQHQGRTAPYMGKGFIWPVHGPIDSPFGYRRHPIFGVIRFHAGIDIGAYTGTPIVAADNGVVIFCGWYGGYGRAVILDHGGGLETLYGHTSRYIVTTGEHVQRGQVIAYVGSTGWSTGPHLHFGVYRNGTPVNPLGYLH